MMSLFAKNVTIGFEDSQKVSSCSSMLSGLCRIVGRGEVLGPGHCSSRVRRAARALLPSRYMTMMHIPHFLLRVFAMEKQHKHIADARSGEPKEKCRRPSPPIGVFCRWSKLLLPQRHPSSLRSTFTPHSANPISGSMGSLGAYELGLNDTCVACEDGRRECRALLLSSVVTSASTLIAFLDCDL